MLGRSRISQAFVYAQAVDRERQAAANAAYGVRVTDPEITKAFSSDGPSVAVCHAAKRTLEPSSRAEHRCVGACVGSGESTVKDCRRDDVHDPRGPMSRGHADPSGRNRSDLTEKLSRYGIISRTGVCPGSITGREVPEDQQKSEMKGEPLSVVPPPPGPAPAWAFKRFKPPANCTPQRGPRY